MYDNKLDKRFVEMQEKRYSLIYIDITNYLINEANNLIKHSSQELFNYLHKTYYSNIDISFMDFFISLISYEGQFILHHNKLIEYGAFKENTQSFNILDRINSLRLIKDVDYLLLNVQEQMKTSGRGSGIKYKIEYIFTPDAFKLILTKSRRESKYALYCILLEKMKTYIELYEKLYKDKLLSMKDDKLDKVINQNNKLTNDVHHLISENKETNNKLNIVVTIAEKQGIKLDEVNETVKRLEIKLDELIKLIHKFLSGQIDLLYTFKSNIRDTKVLIIYKLQNKNNLDDYHLVLRYCGLDMITKMITNFMDKKINKNYKIVSFTIIGAIQENMITIQSIYNELVDINNKHKQTLNNLSNNKCDELIKNIFDIVNINKQKLFTDNLENNKVLKEHCDTMKHLTNLDNKFNLDVNNIIKKYLNEKLFENKSLRVNVLAKELEKTYKQYKN